MKHSSSSASAAAVKTSILGTNQSRKAVERTATVIFFVCGIVAIVAVLAITVYLIVSGAPAIGQVGLLDILFGTVWSPTAAEPSFGIAYLILASILGTSLAICIGVPIGLLAAVFLAEIANSKLANIVRPCVELLAGIPSVVYGLLGAIILCPAMYSIEEAIFANDPDHQMTGGKNLITAVLVLAIMILPTVINVSESSLRAVPQDYRASSLALGASKIQTIFKVTIPAAKSGILTGVVLGIGRALGEAMAVVMVCGNVANLPAPFNSVRFLTTGIVSEMAYSSGLHRQTLFTIGLVLFVFIMIINFIVNGILKKGVNED